MRAELLEDMQGASDLKAGFHRAPHLRGNVALDQFRIGAIVRQAVARRKGDLNGGAKLGGSGIGRGLRLRQGAVDAFAGCECS